MANTIHIITPPLIDIKYCLIYKFTRFRSALLNLGHKVSIFHARPQGIKTDASPAVLWSIVVQWAKKNDHSSKRRRDDPFSEMIWENFDKEYF